MKAAAIQYRPPKGNPQQARREIAALAEEALSRNADIVVFPEMATSGYIWQSGGDLLPHAEPAEGPLFNILSPLARRFGGWVICGFPELGEGDSLYNSALLISPEGLLTACYRKILLFDADMSWALPGSIRIVIDSKIGRIAPGICMDLNDDAFVSFAMESSAGIIPFCTNWLEEGADVWSYWQQRLAGFSGSLIAANSWGSDGGIEFCGHSAIFGPGMELLAFAGREGTEIIYAEI
ncbi:MAG: carbon-nitrogen hydrolase family protein [Spirochaetota bacterium]